ncbi:MAG: HAMP domain-containing histidine kinase [Saprospiraceae bacterium]|nr:HAMP domain-containing histidine kinase [Saprospiraceae bacterium]
MSIYREKSKWKIYLAIAAVVIVGFSAYFTFDVTQKLALEEQKKVEQWAFATSRLSMALDSCDITLHLNIIRDNTTIPVILENLDGGIDAAANFGEEKDLDQEFLKKELEEIKASGAEPIMGAEGQKIYYKKSHLLRMLEIFPFIQFFLITVFVWFGYVAFSSARRFEQNLVWVGMAKETAHQLGTPISAIIGWIDHLRFLKEEDTETMEVMDELRNDVTRLELIADRFSKIGSAPELEPANVYEELEKTKVYMERRAPRKVNFEFPGVDHAPITIEINNHLFHWVIENLLRNALDAMDGKGTISAVVIENGKWIDIEISDTGKGIPSSKFKTVFQPGFTTKKRGWGLGLSLAKRIVEQYHKGKIFVKTSEQDAGTTFTVRMPRA